MISTLLVKSVTMTVSSPDKPHNPMLNGGAIMSCALINTLQPRSGLADKYDFLFNSLHKIGGCICMRVLQSLMDVSLM